MRHNTCRKRHLDRHQGSPYPNSHRRKTPPVFTEQDEDDGLRGLEGTSAAFRAVFMSFVLAPVPGVIDSMTPFHEVSHENVRDHIEKRIGRRFRCGVAEAR